MAALTAMRCGDRVLVRRREDVLCGWNCDRVVVREPMCCFIGWKQPNVRRRRKWACRAALANSSSDTALVSKSKRSCDKDLPPVSAEKLDEWTRKSLAEIVRNVGEAPFLVHVYSNSGYNEDSMPSSSSLSVRLETEPAIPGCWPSIRRRWDDGGCCMPDGIILVEELNGKEAEVDRRKYAESSSRTWGLLVQGRGVDCTVCYILNTCRVLSSIGASTHFCLVRAKCFGDTADEQLKKAWLQQ